MREFQVNIFSDGELVAIKALICFHLLISLPLVVSSHNLTQGLFDQAICCGQWNSSKCMISIAMKNTHALHLHCWCSWTLATSLGQLTEGRENM